MDPLTPEQAEVVAIHNRPVLFKAGPGSGTTRTLVHKFLGLVEQGIPAERILVLTFSQKAAAEMRHRVELATQESVQTLRISTFHSFGYDLIKRYPVESGVPKSYRRLTVFNKFRFVTPLPYMAYGSSLQRAADNCKPADLAANELGTVFQKAIERCAHEDQPLDELAAVTTQDRGWGEFSESDSKRTAEFVESFLASKLGRRKPATENVEVPFTLPLKTSHGLVVTLSGSSDRLDEESDGTWTITGYKSNCGVNSDRYRPQLSIYQLTLERALGRQVGACSAHSWSRRSRRRSCGSNRSALRPLKHASWRWQSAPQPAASRSVPSQGRAAAGSFPSGARRASALNVPCDGNLRICLNAELHRSLRASASCAEA
jgi:UvrD/REP helicase N-terminal domain